MCIDFEDACEENEMPSCATAYAMPAYVLMCFGIRVDDDTCVACMCVCVWVGVLMEREIFRYDSFGAFIYILMTF